MTQAVAAGTHRATTEAVDLGAHVLLAIDTAIGTSVALGVDGRIISAWSDDARGHAEHIGELLAAVFAEVSPARVTGVVAGIGPGPFTGLRVGIAAAHAFALARAVPLLPLHGHEAVALEALEPDGATATHPRGPVRVLQDAKRRELFVTEYAGLDEAGIPVRGAEPRLVARAELGEETGDIWPERIPAAGLVRLAARRLAVGRGFEADEALYIRQPDIYPPAQPKRVST